MRKLIIEARVNEYAMRDENPLVPWTPEEIARDAAACAEAGAAVVHFHARQADGAPEHGYDAYAETCSRIRAACPALIHPTLGYVALGAPAEERLRNVLRLAAVRRAGERELVVAPAHPVEAAGRDQRHHLERLGARAPEGDGARIARGHDRALGRVDHGRVHAVPGFDDATARGHDIERER